MSNPFKETLETRQQAEDQRRFEAIEKVNQIIGFLNLQEGKNWLLAQARKNQRPPGEEWNSFLKGQTTGLVFHLGDVIPARYLEFTQDFRIVWAGKREKVAEAYWGERVAVYYPKVAEDDVLTYDDLGSDDLQRMAIAKAMAEAAAEYPSVKKNEERYRCVIFRTQPTGWGNPYGCLVLKHYSPEELVSEVGADYTQRLFNSFMEAVKQEG